MEEKHMNENVIKFRKPQPPKQPRPNLRKALTILGVIAFFVAAWAYYQYLG